MSRLRGFGYHQKGTKTARNTALDRQQNTPAAALTVARRDLDVKTRLCLRCDKRFPSNGPGNRVCKDCKAAHDDTRGEGCKIRYSR